MKHAKPLLFGTAALIGTCTTLLGALIFSPTFHQADPGELTPWMGMKGAMGMATVHSSVDFSADGLTDLDDLEILLDNLGNVNATRSSGDLNADGVVDIHDWDLASNAFEKHIQMDDPQVMVLILEYLRDYDGEEAQVWIQRYEAGISHG